MNESLAQALAIAENHPAAVSLCDDVRAVAETDPARAAEMAVSLHRALREWYESRILSATQGGFGKTAEPAGKVAPVAAHPPKDRPFWWLAEIVKVVQRKRGARVRSKPLMGYCAANEKPPATARYWQDDDHWVRFPEPVLAAKQEVATGEP